MDAVEEYLAWAKEQRAKQYAEMLACKSAVDALVAKSKAESARDDA